MVAPACQKPNSTAPLGGPGETAPRTHGSARGAARRSRRPRFSRRRRRSGPASRRALPGAPTANAWRCAGSPFVVIMAAQSGHRSGGPTSAAGASRRVRTRHDAPSSPAGVQGPSEGRQATALAATGRDAAGQGGRSGGTREVNLASDLPVGRSRCGACASRSNIARTTRRVALDAVGKPGCGRHVVG